MRKRVLQISIKEARIRKGITQLELAQKLGTHVTAVSSWEAGRWRPSAKHLLELKELLDCSVDELLSDDVSSDKRRVRRKKAV